MFFYQYNFLINNCNAIIHFSIIIIDYKNIYIHVNHNPQFVGIDCYLPNLMMSAFIIILQSPAGINDTSCAWSVVIDSRAQMMMQSKLHIKMMPLNVFCVKTAIVKG